MKSSKDVYIYISYPLFPDREVAVRVIVAPAKQMLYPADISPAKREEQRKSGYYARKREARVDCVVTRAAVCTSGWEKTETREGGMEILSQVYNEPRVVVA